MNMIIGSMLGRNPMESGLEKLTGGENGGDGVKDAPIEDPEIVQARLEAEERRKEKHRKIENEREKMRQTIREKYNIKKKEDLLAQDEMCAGRIGAVRRKTPEELAKEAEEDDSLGGQVNQMFDKTKTAATGLFDSVKTMFGAK